MIEFTIHRAIKQVIEEKAPSVQWFDIYNAQPENEEQETAINYPAVFTQFNMPQWVNGLEAIGANATAEQRGLMQVTVRCYYEALDDIRNIIDSGLETFLNEVYHAVSGLEGDNFTKLVRVSSEQFSPYENVLNWNFVFNTYVIEPGNSKDETDATDGGLIPITLVLNKDLDIDNTIIRTGDGNI